MPSLRRLTRIARLATLPETRGLALAAARSQTLHDIARRARHDRASLVRDLRNPDNTRGLVRDAIRHPATEELVSTGLVLLPWRYLPVGWVAAWATRKVVKRYVDPPQEVIGSTAFGSPRTMKNVTPNDAR